MQRPVDPALLTASRSSGPAAHRARPGKQDTSKKVRFMSLKFYDRTKHNTCTAGVQSSSSSAAGGHFRARSRRKSSSSTCLQPAGGQEREVDVKAGQDSIFGNLGIFGTFLKISENFR